MFIDHKKYFTGQYIANVLSLANECGIELTDHKQLYDLLKNLPPQQDQDIHAYQYVLAKYARFLLDVSYFEEVTKQMTDHRGYQIWFTGYLLILNQINTAQSHFRSITPPSFSTDDPVIIFDFIYMYLELLYMKKDYAGMISYFDSKRKYIEESAVIPIFTNLGIQYLLAVAYFILGKDTLSKEIIDEALEQARKVKEPYFETRLISLLGQLAQYDGNLELAADKFSKALTLAKSTHIQAEIALQLRMISNLEEYKGNYEQAYQYVKQAEDINRSLNNVSQLIKNIYSSAIILTKLTKYKEAKRNFLEVKRIYSNVNNHLGVLRSLNGLGIISHDQGHINEAISYFSRALQLAEQHGYSKNRLNLLNNIGTLYKIKGDFIAAEKFFKKAIHLLEQNQASGKNPIRYYLNYAELQMFLGNYQYSLEFIDNNVVLESHNKEMVGYYYYLKSRLYFYMGEMVLAQNMAMQSLENFKRTKSPFNIAMGYKQVAKIKHIIKDDQHAIDLLIKAQHLLENAESFGDLYQSIYLDLIEVQTNQYDFNAAQKNIQNFSNVLTKQLEEIPTFRKYQLEFLQVLLRSYEDAVSYSQLAAFYKTLQNTDFFSLKMKMVLLLINEEIKQQQIDHAVQLINEGLGIAKTKNNVPLQLEFNFLMGLVLAKQKQYQKAKTICLQYSSLIENQNLTAYRNQQHEILERIKNQQQFDLLCNTIDTQDLKDLEAKENESDHEIEVLGYLQHIMRRIEEPSMEPSLNIV